MKTNPPEILSVLELRFAENPFRHKDIDWDAVRNRLDRNPIALAALASMEETGGQPDVIGRAERTDEIIFVDCAPESPQGRLSVCYDRDGLESRREHKPRANACDMAAEMGVEILDEALYRQLQKLGQFDCKTSSWILTPPGIRQRGGALFGDRRYGQVFVYHNGAQSYYGTRGFRAVLRV